MRVRAGGKGRLRLSTRMGCFSNVPGLVGVQLVTAWSQICSRISGGSSSRRQRVLWARVSEGLNEEQVDVYRAAAALFTASKASFNGFLGNMFGYPREQL